MARVGNLIVLLALSGAFSLAQGSEGTCTYDSNGNPEKGCSMLNSDVSGLLQAKVKMADDVEVEDDDDDDLVEEEDPSEVDHDEEQAGILEHSMLVHEEETIADEDTSDQYIYDPPNGDGLMQAEEVLRLADELDSSEHREASRVYTADHFDCSDELILRMAMSHSFEAPIENLVKCEAHGRANPGSGGSGGSGKKNGSGGSGKNKAGSGGGSSVSKTGKVRTGSYEAIRGVESKLSKCQQSRGHQVSLGPRLVRMVGHDAADYKNTIYANGSQVTNDVGGVDSCLHSALISQGLQQVQDEETVGEETSDEKMSEEEAEIIKGDANHNRGLGNAVAWVISFAEASMLSRPDVEVLGATVYLEAWSASAELGTRFGRVRGQCLQPVCLSEKCWTPSSQFFKASAGVPVGAGAFCPYTNSITPLKNVLGLTVEEFVALQGAHSVGGVMMCSGMGDISSGPFCPTDKCAFPPVIGSRPGFDIRGLGFGGTSFDQTPGKLDNEYYKQLKEEKYEVLPDCKDLEKPFPHIQRGGSGGGGPVIMRGEERACTKRGKSEKQIACKSRSRHWPGVFSDPDAENTCKTGVQYNDEDQCEQGDCAENCMRSQVCQDSLDVLQSDAAALSKAWIGCNACKLKCKSSKASLLFMEKLGKSGKGGNNKKKKGGSPAPSPPLQPPAPSGPKRKVNWCKSLPPFKVCNDPKYTTGNRRGANSCGTCPKDKCFSGVNLGGGRGAGIKSVNRWSLFRGVVKRVMVLPSDWSYLKDAELKKAWNSYADDNSLFLNQFAVAWKKTTEKGKENALKSCKKVTCTLSTDGIACPVQAATEAVRRYQGHKKLKHGSRAGEGENSATQDKATHYERPKQVLFEKSNCDAGLPSSGDCHLVGAIGVRGKFKCGDWEGTCCDSHRGCDLIKKIDEEWKSSGGQDGTCSLPPLPKI